jgi:hypothetical protein
MEGDREETPRKEEKERVCFGPPASVSLVRPGVLLPEGPMMKYRGGCAYCATRPLMFSDPTLDSSLSIWLFCLFTYAVSSLALRRHRLSSPAHVRSRRQAGGRGGPAGADGDVGERAGRDAGLLRLPARGGGGARCGGGGGGGALLGAVGRGGEAGGGVRVGRAGEGRRTF